MHMQWMEIRGEILTLDMAKLDTESINKSYHKF